MKKLFPICAFAIVSVAGSAQEQQPRFGFDPAKKETLKVTVTGKEDQTDILLVTIDGKNFRLNFTYGVPEEYLKKYNMSISVGDEITLIGNRSEFTNNFGREVRNFITYEVKKGDATMPLLDKDGCQLYTSQYPPLKR